MTEWRVGDRVVSVRHFFDTSVYKDTPGVVVKASWSSIDVRFDLSRDKYEEVKGISHRDVK